MRKSRIQLQRGSELKGEVIKGLWRGWRGFPQPGDSSFSRFGDRSRQEAWL